MNNFHVTILTIFPEMFPGPLGCSLAGKGLEKNYWSLDVINIREFGRTKHKNVDDVACGGGNGLIMRPDVLGSALDKALDAHPGATIYYPSPRGIPLTQDVSKKIVQDKNVIILCGRFEGIDERVIDEYNVQQISVGDYVLSGGEVAAITILDSVVRLLPGVLANQETLKAESFEVEIDGLQLIEHPLYTKPSVWRGREVPEVLLSGNHARIEKWKMTESIRVTRARHENYYLGVKNDKHD
ncbi:MAG: tRNA (guanosine(37)-N1)-methyltransferase TrmD [Rickettsiaceae bacterium]|nr:tRNA (guanosine(37)-N1)-methyltransferase TrmD [Rickettsiaceae bacterium]MDP4832865.1 tRNA (guanosine(37)-N1)-methyltransferase TrmD [Rickettsiaceae bacterium]MDP5021079.1 tRNA (guanosine(37)-N1)-methyltransferase TrmD [Rickettsiaceae bacterium]MDP5082793.1 tRNA (guanosine(37)-N1)-methyltransferase TrmD [Rickettsiaceae bacterium]